MKSIILIFKKQKQSIKLVFIHRTLNISFRYHPHTLHHKFIVLNVFEYVNNKNKILYYAERKYVYNLSFDLWADWIDHKCF